MPNRSEYPASSMHLEQCSFLAAVVGAGTGAPTVAATSAVSAADNFAASATRTSEGLYVVTLKEKFPVILHVIPEVVAASGAFKHANVVSWDVAAGTITVTARLADGTGVDDLETTDTLRLWVQARKST